MTANNNKYTLKNIIRTAAAVTAIAMLAGCGAQAESAADDTASVSTSAADTAAGSSSVSTDTAELKENTVRDEQLDEAIAVLSSSSDSSVNQYEITSAGTYRFTGTSSQGINIDAGSGDVVIVLDGAEISSSEEPAVYVKSAGTVTILSQADTVNSLTCSAVNTDESTSDSKVTSAVYSKSDIILGGNGTINITSENGMGIKSKGNVSAENGTVNITSADNGISADVTFTLAGADVTVSAGGGYENAAAHSSNDFGRGFGGRGQQNDTSSESTADSSPDDTAKGIKTDVSIVIESGILSIDSSDDALHSNGDITVKGGDITISSGDDAVHADNALTADGGTITIPVCYEGLEGYYVTINGGTIDLTASDDGINAASPDSDSDTFMTGGDDSFIIVNGGTVNVRSNGDGMDSNGKLEFNGGDITVTGPANSDNSAFDSDGEFVINGGNVLGLGSSQMAESPSEGAQNVICISAQISGEINITDSNGNSVFTYTADGSYSSAVISDADIAQGETYTVTANGTELGTVEMSGAVGQIGSMSGGFGGHGGFGGGNRPDRQNGGFPDREDSEGGFGMPDFKNFDSDDSDVFEHKGGFGGRPFSQDGEDGGRPVMPDDTDGRGFFPQDGGRPGMPGGAENESSDSAGTTV